MTLRRTFIIRGLTLIELLAALALLGMLTAALVSWTQTTLRVGAQISEVQLWLRAADAVLARIGEDLLVGDFEPPDRDDQSSPTSRIAATTDGLVISTRSAAAPVDHVYELERFTNDLIRRSGDSQSRLLGKVGEFSCSIHDEARILTVTISSTDGLTCTGRFALR